MTEVAAAAGIGRATLHRHFGSQCELSRALTADEQGREDGD
jgi:AcrR family transcriptional regulator